MTKKASLLKIKSNSFEGFGNLCWSLFSNSKFGKFEKKTFVNEGGQICRIGQKLKTVLVTFKQVSKN
jgi:hypothetical protein